MKRNIVSVPIPCRRPLQGGRCLGLGGQVKAAGGQISCLSPFPDYVPGTIWGLSYAVFAKSRPDGPLFHALFQRLLLGQAVLSGRKGFDPAAGEGFDQADKLADFPDFLRERFPGEFLPHLLFHITGSLRLYFCRMFPNHVLSKYRVCPHSLPSASAGR